MHWHLFNLKLCCLWCVSIAKCPKEILPYCPKRKINLDFLIYMISHWHSVKFSYLTFLKMRKHFLIIPVCVNTWICCIYSKLYSLTYLLSFSKIWLAFLTKNTIVKVFKKENKTNIPTFFFFWVTFDVFSKFGTVELG